MYIHILGVTCVGKDTLIEHIINHYPDTGAVQVGKEFRKRYPPDHFHGLGAMASTEDEAKEIYLEQLEKIKDKKYKLISSQPRLISQVAMCEERGQDEQILYVFIRASEAEIERRINERFPLNPRDGNYEKNEQNRKLASKRILNDRIQNYDVLLELLALQAEIIVLESCELSTLADCVMSHIKFCEGH